MSVIGIDSAASPVPVAPARPVRDAFPRRLRNAVARELPNQALALPLVRDFLAHPRADARFAAELIAIGRGAHGEPWPVRLVAGRMLEWQILALSRKDVAAHRALFDRLGVAFTPREGFTARNDAERVAQFRARLGRFAFVHRGIDGLETPAEALERFLRSARRPCLVPVARYLFSHDEVLDQVYGHTRQSKGVRDPDCDMPRALQDALAGLPEREARLAAALADTHEIFWVGAQTPSQMNSLIEYPLGTVALTIKPPGSDAEIEIKRAGIRGKRAWDVIFTRNGHVVCSAHHLQGAAVGRMLEWQASAEARFAAIWQGVHGESAPISKTLRVNSVFKLPLDGGGFAGIARFFTDRQLYGEGYDHMRGEMKLALNSLLRFDGEPPYDAPNDFALTGRFLGSVKPGQAVQVGTTSFRLDRVARYLGPDGARGYFEELGVAWTSRDATAFADELLSEILVDYVPPAPARRTYRGYLRTAFAIPANRARADRNYLDAVRQVGRMFGTCIAVLAGSNGESYVARNVGLRSVFEDGAWKLRVIFVDHDALHVPERTDREIHPQDAARRIVEDFYHTLGKQTGPGRTRGTLRLLAGIYRVSPALRRKGLAAFHAAAGDAWRATRAALPGSSFFHPKWLERLEDFDRAMQTLLRAGRATRAWRESIPPLLEARRQTTRALIAQYLRGIGGFHRLWRRLPSLHVPHDPKGEVHAPPATAAG